MTFNPFLTENQQLMIGSYRVSDLADTYQTPLFIMDEALIRSKMRTFKDVFQSPLCASQVIYASKAFLNLAMCQLVNEEGLFLDVVSGGELYTAHKANFPMEKILFHGNNKTLDELKMAIGLNVGRIVVDNLTELEHLISIQNNQTINILLRVNPGIEAHTHEYIATSKHDSKFGVSIFDESTIDLIKLANIQTGINFKGLHCHIGSQILDGSSFIKEIDVLLDYVHALKQNHSIEVDEINIGGGFGVAYTKGEVEMDIKHTLPQILEHVYAYTTSHSIKTPKIFIEPGRSIVANAGITVYKVGAVKTTHNKKNYVFVDGSMADHIRTALYQAKYEAALIDRMDEPNSNHYTIAGRACESGDIIIHDCELPEVKLNDYLAVFTTGAYHYSMSSNYNRILKPAVIFVNNDKARVVNKRETYEDLVRQDCL
ncbi:MAG TPA: diaminopimelate decarboxylase [Erysipelotrichaceae bacterium]|nr:diaminopimelate decarboxylase [Erysipelotrichaceae bacterium]